MAMQKADLRLALSGLFKSNKHTFGRYAVNISDTTDRRYTEHGYRQPVIVFGVQSLPDVVTFSDYVHCIIDAFHEMQHCKQYWIVRRGHIVNELAVDLYADVGSREYDTLTYGQHYCEWDAQIAGVEHAREFLHRHYPMYKSELDEHIFYWTKLWCFRAAPDIVFDDTTDLDDLLNKSKDYRDSLLQWSEPFEYKDITKSDDLIAKWIVDHRNAERVSYLDDAFMNATNGREQRQAAFDITLSARREDMMKLVPAVKRYVSPLVVKYREIPDIQSECSDENDFDITS